MNLLSQVSCGDLYCCYCFSKLLLLCLFFQTSLWGVYWLPTLLKQALVKVNLR